VKPDRPPALDEAPTTEGAGDVLSYYLQLFPYAQNTGDLADVRVLSHPECVHCSGVIRGVEELLSWDEHSEGGGLSISDIAVLEVDPARFYSVRLTLVEQPSREVSASGSVVEEFPGPTTYVVEGAVLHEGGTWAIREVSFETVT
jgi:hypothetical protein